MTKVTYIHGAPSVPQDEQTDRGQNVPNQRYINAGAMTSGELKIALLREQANIMANYYPEVPEFKQAEQELENVLFQGLHDINMTGYGSETARRAIRQAKRKTRPAAGYFTRSREISGIIPAEDCQQYVIDEGSIYSETPEYQKCKERNEEINILNDHLEDSAHHLLYEYLENRNAAPGVVVSKSQDHRNAISVIAELFEFDRENVELWVRNGIIRNNAQEGTQPFQPEKTINILKEEVPAASIGGGEYSAELRGAFLVALPIILKAIAGAVLATATLIGAIKQQKAARIRNTAQGIGSYTFGPEEGDWKNQPGGNGPGTGPGLNTSDLLSNENLPLILGGLGAFLLLR